MEHHHRDPDRVRDQYARQEALRLVPAPADAQRLFNAFVQAGPDFYNIPQVVNGCSDLMVEALGEAGKHARSAVGMYKIPLGFAVEIDALIEVLDRR